MLSQTLIVGGGAAGFFAAIRRAECFPEEEVLILERGREVLSKVRISGGGRCNVTHACWDPAELVTYYPRGGRELLGPFHHFACGDTVGWFEDRGVALKVEDDGRIFPVSDDSASIVDCLRQAARRAGVGVRTGVRVEGITARAAAGGWAVSTAAGQLYADRLLVTSGSNPAVWKLLAELGHTVVPPVPSLFALNIRDERLRDLAGVSLPWAQLRVEADGLQSDGPLLITHRGLSGPAVLRLSAWGARHLHPRKYDFTLCVNWIGQRGEDAGAELLDAKRAHPRRRVATRPLFGLPLRLWQRLVDAAGLPAEQQWAQLSTAQHRALVNQLTAAHFRVTGKATNKEEFTTAGGVALEEVDFRAFRSRLHPTLYLAGEVLDVDAVTGGFNFQAAWTGGWLSGGAGD